MDELEHQLNLIDNLQAVCTRCGICSESCPTFQASGWEHDSPRGRIRLAHDFIEGRIEPTSLSLTTFDHCIGCGACEIACPLSVEYGAIRSHVQQVRRQLACRLSETPSSLYSKWIKNAYRIGSSRWRRYGKRWLTLPWLPWAKIGGYAAINKSKATPDCLTLAVSCVQALFCGPLIESAVQLLTALGYQIRLDANQPCCGAILDRLAQGGEESVSHQKEQRQAVRYQNKRTAAFFKMAFASNLFPLNGLSLLSPKKNKRTIRSFS